MAGSGVGDFSGGGERFWLVGLARWAVPKKLLCGAEIAIVGGSRICFGFLAEGRFPNPPDTTEMKLYPPAQGLYDPRSEHDACGVGFICQMKGVASHQLVSDALQMLENMNHRG